MSVNDQPDPGAAAPIARTSALGRALDGYTAPPLSADFAARVVAAAEVREASALPPLPDLRRPARKGRWRIGQRIAIGAISFGALATAAAATGLLQRLDLPVPSAGTVWASITGSAAPAAAAARPEKPAIAAAPAAPATPAAVEITGPVDTPEELAEAFRRIDNVRASRREDRRASLDQRIDAEIARRRAAGLRVPTPEEEARIRERLEAAQTRRQQALDTRIGERREVLQRKVEAGEAVTREDMAGPLRSDPARGDRATRLRDMTPAQRREALRNLPPEDRRALIEAWRSGRAARQGAQAPAKKPAPAAPAASPSPDLAPPQPSLPDQ